VTLDICRRLFSLYQPAFSAPPASPRMCKSHQVVTECAMLNDVEGFTELRERNPTQWSIPFDELFAYQGLCKSCY